MVLTTVLLHSLLHAPDQDPQYFYKALHQIPLHKPYAIRHTALGPA